MEGEICDFLKKIEVVIYTAVIHKESYWEQYPSQNPYHIAYTFLIERFQKYLDLTKTLGICIIDPREGQTEKHFIGNELIEKLLFSQSDQTVGIQIADLYCYPIFHTFEYNKSKSEYWRFRELSYPKLYKHGTITDGYGLKYFPNITKKDLKFFS